jgi:predicted transcriptional regulator
MNTSKRNSPKKTQPVGPRPTQGELEILAVLWRRGPSSVRDVHVELEQLRPMGYTTVLKLLQIMTEKGLVERDERQRTHIYAARAPRDETQRQLLDDLLERAFAGSAATLVMQALATHRASRQELEAIRRMLDEMDGGRR